MGKVQTAANRISRWMAWLAGAIIIFGCAIPISIDVLSRAIIGVTVVESFEISGYALAACIGLGLGYTVSTKANIRVDILAAKLPRPLRRVADLLASVSLAVTAVAAAYYTFDVIADSLRLDARSESTLRVPLVVPQFIWWAGFAWFATVACLTPAYAVLRLFSGDRQTFDDTLSSTGLTEELRQIGVRTDGDGR